MTLTHHQRHTIIWKIGGSLKPIAKDLVHSTGQATEAELGYPIFCAKRKIKNILKSIY